MQGLDPLVADQRLRELGVALSDVDEVVDDPPLRAEHEVEIAQADVEIDDADLLAGLRERRADRGGRGGLAHPAFSGRYDDHLAHGLVPLDVSVQGPELELLADQSDLEAPALEFGVHVFGGRRRRRRCTGVRRAPRGRRCARRASRRCRRSPAPAARHRHAPTRPRRSRRRRRRGRRSSRRRRDA